LLAKPFGSVKPKGWPERRPYVPYLEDPALAEFFDGYRSALESGDAHVTDTGTVDGHDVTWIEFAFFGNEATERVAVDKASSLPIRIEHIYKGKVEQSYGVVSIETLPEGSGDFSKLKKRPSSSFSIARDNVTSISESDAALALPGALWVGKRISTLQLLKVSRAALTSQNLSNGSAPVVGTGIELHYGDGSPGGLRGDEPLRNEKPYGSYVWLQEAALSDQFYWFWPREEPPSGSVLVESGNRRGDCDGFMVKDRIHVTILASSRELLLEAARALESIPVSAGPG
jgi:hypothetical protein